MTLSVFAPRGPVELKTVARVRVVVLTVVDVSDSPWFAGLFAARADLRALACCAVRARPPVCPPAPTRPALVLPCLAACLPMLA